MARASAGVRPFLLAVLALAFSVAALVGLLLWWTLSPGPIQNDRAIRFTPEIEPAQDAQSVASAPPVELPPDTPPADAPPLQPDPRSRVGAGVTPPVFDLAARFLAALNAGDSQTALSLMIGFESAAARQRDAALSQEDFLNREDLSAQQRLAVLALRDQYSRAEIEALTLEQIMLTSPGNGPLLPAPDSPIQLASLRLDGGGVPRLRLVLGLQERTLALAPVQTADGQAWRVQGDFLFDPLRLTPRDAEILTQVGDKGGGNRAWLQVYAAMTQGEENPALLQPPS